MEHYSILRRMQDVYDREARKMPSDVTGNFAAWQKEARKKLRELLALDKFEKAPLSAKLLSKEKRDGYTVEKREMETEPDVFMPFYVLIPDGACETDKRACVITPHGHGGGKNGTVREFSEEELALLPPARRERMGKSDCFALSLVKRGYIVLAPDARGAGERREFMNAGPENAFTNSHAPINNLAISLGYSMCGMEVFDLMCLADYAVSRPDADGRLGAGGMSGGGQQTLFFAACDERISVSVVSGWFYGFKESLLLLPHNCACNFVPDLWKYFDCCDIGALIAPRALHIESGENDHLNGNVGKIQNVVSQVEITRKAYKALNAESELLHFIHPGVHEWNGSMAYDFISPRLPAKL